ncbi:MAG: type II secretion system F family protein [Candidatus Nanoarchaeia archaeon]
MVETLPPLLNLPFIKGPSKFFKGIAEFFAPSFLYLDIELKQLGIRHDLREYLALCFTAMFTAFLFLLAVFIPLFILLQFPVLFAFIFALVFSFFIFIQQIMYPKLAIGRQQREMEKDLLPALRMILIQLNAGVSLFDAFVAISNEDYGIISKEAKQIVKKIHSGQPAVEALETSATNNSSLHYRRALWQLVNGMKSGSSTTVVLKEIIESLSKEQLIQIESYGSQLNPLAMFYMLIAVILPSLGMTLIIILSSLINIGPDLLKLILFGMIVGLMLFQILFLGLIKTRRPSLLED